MPPFKLPAVPRAKRLRNYIVDCNGVVFSLSKKFRVRGSLNSKGYLQLPNKVLLHRLVAEAWCPNQSQARPHVNHKDGNKVNNHPSNLEWCSAAENNAHARAIGLR